MFGKADMGVRFGSYHGLGFIDGCVFLLCFQIFPIILEFFFIIYYGFSTHVHIANKSNS